MSELKSVEYWQSLISKSNSEEHWMVMAATFIGRLAMLPAANQVPNDIANGARILFAAAPETVIESASVFMQEIARQATEVSHESERGIEDIESYLEWESKNDNTDRE